MSYLALPESPISTLVANWLVFGDGLVGVEVMSRPLTWIGLYFISFHLLAGLIIDGT